jgi:hypothetical protein
MHKLTPNIPESAESALESVLYSPIWTLKTNDSLAPKFLSICTLVDHAISNNFPFESGD